MDIILITTIKPNVFVGLLIYFMTPTNVLLSKGAWYHSSGYKNSRNNRYWYTKTSTLIHEGLLNIVRIRVR